MLNSEEIVATIPATDIDRAKKFYSDTLGFGDAEEYPGGWLFKSGPSTFCLYPTMSSKPAEHTLASWSVSDVDSTVKELKASGVTFEDYDYPELKTVDSIAEKDGMRCAWFKDSEGNILSVTQK